MKRIDVVKKGEGWVAESGNQVVARAHTKANVVKETARYARAATEPVTVKIHLANGRFQQERTYPQAADPRKSKG